MTITDSSRRSWRNLAASALLAGATMIASIAANADGSSTGQVGPSALTVTSSTQTVKLDHQKPWIRIRMFHH